MACTNNDNNVPPFSPYEPYDPEQPLPDDVIPVIPMDRIRVAIDRDYRYAVIVMEKDDQELPNVVSLDARSLTAFIFHLRVLLQEIEHHYIPPTPQY